MKRSDLPISSPCAALWDTMTVRGRALFCDECQTLVHDLSRLQRNEAADFLRAHVGEQMCVKYSYDAFGNVLFAAPVQAAVIPASMLRPSVRALAAATALLGATFVYDRGHGDANASDTSTVKPLPVQPEEVDMPLQSLDIPPAPAADEVFSGEQLVGTVRGQTYGTLGGAMLVSDSHAFAHLADPAPTVKFLPAKVSNAGLDPLIVRRFLKRNANKITYCYQKRVLAEPALHGTVLAEFTVSAEGQVTDATAAGVDAEVEQCVVEVIKSIEFPRPRAGAIKVTVPLRLRVE